MKSLAPASLTLRAGLLGAAAAAATPVIAQDAEEPVIVVTGEGLEETPASPAYDTQTIEREQIVSAPSGRIEDVLSSVAGFQQFRRSDSRSSNPSAQGATLRALGGNATSRALVLLDGVPMADPFFGFIPFTAIAPERLGEIRVTRGGGAGSFGAGALAGTIELVSAGAADLDGFGGQVLVNDRGGTESALHTSSQLSDGFGVISARWDRGPGFFTTPKADRVDASAKSAYDSWSTQLRGVVPVGEDAELQVRGLVYDDRRTLRFDGADSSSSGQDASIRLVGRGDWQYEALAYVQARNFTNTVISSTRFVPVLDQRNTPSTGLGGKLEVRPPVQDDQVLRLGVDYRRSDGELFETAISAFSGRVNERRNAGGTNSDLGFFVEHEWLLGPVTLTGGARLDRYAISDGFYEARDASGNIIRSTRFEDRSGWQDSYRGGVLFRVSDALRLRAAAYTGLRLPTLNELYRPFVVFPVTTNANASLRNERLEGVEAGFDLTPAEGMELSATVFDNKVEGAIANVTLDATTRQRQNIDEIRARGVEVSAGLSLDTLRFDLSLAYTDAEARDAGAVFDGNRPAQTPRWAGGATLSWRPAADWLLAASLRHTGDQFEDDLETDVLPATTTFGVYAQAPVTRRLAVVLRGENLFDEEIVTRNQGGSIDLGVPRTVWAGIKLGL
ncbi:TonB-dependent receptor [Qipengyuania nanhaisediminis]|uniref:TonB-dependent receptor n=1 Tax=Qipengyuania nanhaisediminis TaxID=604088 RepID=UPI000B86EA94|nr:TonB-dependent receptor [Qipengyuania nanhaisediminis]